MTTPLVSILIPCFNAGPLLAQAIESSVRQTWPAKETIVVNDGSDDDSLEIARRYQCHGVKVIDQANLGASAARNTALRVARGEFVQFLDADDLLAPDKIERQMRRIAGFGGRVLASGAWARFVRSPEDGVFTPFANWRDLTGLEFLQLHYEQGCMMHPAAWLAPRSLLDSAGAWNESLSLNDDGEYFARVMLLADYISFCPEARSYYRSGQVGTLSGRNDGKAMGSLYRSVELTLAGLLASDRSPRTLAAAAYAWKWTAYELYPASPELSKAAEEQSKLLGGSAEPIRTSGTIRLAGMILGWRLAKRIFSARSGA